MAELFLRGGGMNFLDDTIIRMVVAFVAGEPSRRLLPLSRRFVPEPMQMCYIVTKPRVMRCRDLLDSAAFLPHAVGDAMRREGMRDHRDAIAINRGHELMCSICC